MSRSGYSDDVDDHWALIRWRGAVNSALNGKRGQQFLRELAAAMDAMPEKRLIADELQAEGMFCALGVTGAARGLDMTNVDAHDREQVSALMNIAEAMAAEVMYENDACVHDEEWIDVEICGPMRPRYPDYGRHVRSVCVPARNVEERRWRYMRNWVAQHIKEKENG
jgi:hypothetical protein